MNARLEAVEELFEATVDLDAAARTRALAAAFPTDRASRALVERLVRAHHAADGPLDRSIAERVQSLAAGTDSAAGEDLSGTVVGRFRLDERLSTGGMGSVYLATATTGAAIERRVAIKVVHARLADSGEVRARFGHEQRVLAALHHDHIVTFLDTGELPDGRPFLVMEHVNGVPIPVACAGRNVRDRVELFAEVLAAVGHAHEHGVVHADLKPDNVLVTEHGSVRLVDFGVAVLSGAETRGEAGNDPSGATAMTPEYASPEQLEGGPATTRSDVFSLGLVLDECLRAGDAERIPADLRAIVTRATHPRAESRYASTAAFAADLASYLDGRPVAAVGGGIVYRARRYATRHPVRFAVALLAVASLALTIATIELNRRDARSEASRGWGAHLQAKLTVHALEEWIRTLTAQRSADPVEIAAPLEARLAAGEFDAHPETEGLLRLALATFYVETAERPELARVHVARVRELVASGDLSAAELRRVDALLVGG